MCGQFFGFLHRKKNSSLRKELTIPLVMVAEEVIARTKGLLLSYSEPKEHHEGIVYWAGLNTTEGIIILAAISPKATTTSGSVNVGVMENSQVVSAVNDLGLQMVAQVHSHPFDCGVSHSTGDNDMVFMPYEGLLSIVVGDYGLGGLLPLSRNGVHIFHDGRWIGLSDKQVEEHFIVIPTHVELRNE